jgi:hypothetical protein
LGEYHEHVDDRDLIFCGVLQCDERNLKSHSAAEAHESWEPIHIPTVFTVVKVDMNLELRATSALSRLRMEVSMFEDYDAAGA